jgi:hypothetical protein
MKIENQNPKRTYKIKYYYNKGLGAIQDLHYCDIGVLETEASASAKFDSRVLEKEQRGMQVFLSE